MVDGESPSAADALSWSESEKEAGLALSAWFSQQACFSIFLHSCRLTSQAYSAGKRLRPLKSPFFPDYLTRLPYFL